MTGSFSCPRCGGPLFHDWDEKDPELLWWECTDCGELFDIDSVHVTDESEAA